jgi:hypothetical protein
LPAADELDAAVAALDDDERVDVAARQREYASGGWKPFGQTTT